MNRVVADRYVIVGELGRGGMGVVWRADDRVIGRQVALKEIQVPPGGMERVLREARTAGRLNDPGVVTVYDVLTDRGSTFVVMELVEAPTLADIMAAQGPLDPNRVAGIGLALLSALEVAHAAGVVHRDVKPSNVMLLPGDRVKLADFGIARAMDDPGHTASGVLGSPGYLAPELFNGGFPSPASDLWALGTTLFHAVEGYGPFHRETTAATLHAIMYEEPELRLCPPGPLADAIMGLLIGDPYQRWTPAQVRQALSGGPRLVATRPVDPWQDEPKPSRRKALLIGGAAAAVVVVATTSAVLLTSSGQQDGVASAAAVSSSTTVTTTSSVAPTTTTTTATSTATTTKTTHTTTTATTTTATSATTTTSSKPLALMLLTRYANPKGFHFSGTPKVPAPAGFTMEGPLGSLVATPEPGTVKFYECKMKSTDDRFSSLDQTGECEGETMVAVLGYVYLSKPSGVVTHPLYRCNSGVSHFDSVMSNCESSKVTNEGPLGYVVSVGG